MALLGQFHCEVWLNAELLQVRRVLVAAEAWKIGAFQGIATIGWWISVRMSSRDGRKAGNEAHFVYLAVLGSSPITNGEKNHDACEGYGSNLKLGGHVFCRMVVLWRRDWWWVYIKKADGWFFS
jgi:hypothetical protein